MNTETKNMMKNKTEEIKKKIKDLPFLTFSVLISKEIDDVFPIDGITDELIEKWKKLSDEEIRWEDYFVIQPNIEVLKDESYLIRNMVWEYELD